MSEEQEVAEEQEAPTKPSLLKTLIPAALSVLILGAVAAGVAFLLPGGKTEAACADAGAAHGKMETKDYKNTAFVNLDPLIISLGPNAQANYLKISITLETNDSDMKDVEHLKPKFRDVLNTYLRAVNEHDLVEPAAMIRLRAQMQRRIQLIAPHGAVENVLITDFVLN